MTKSVQLNPKERSVTLLELVVENPEFFSLILKEPDAQRDAAVRSVIALGTTASSLLRTSIDAEFVERKFAELTTGMGRALDEVREKAVIEITKRFSPTESGSYTKQIGELVESARKKLDDRSSEFAKAARDLLDPEKKSSAVGQLSSVINHAAAEFAEMFDPARKDSYASQLSGHLDALFGSGERAGTISRVIGEAMKPLFEELRTLREKVGESQAAQKVADVTTLKGQVFEDVVERRLCDLARPFGDTVEPVGTGPGGAKSGDFVIDLAGSRRRIAVEARNRKVTGPTMKQDLRKAMAARGADYGILVVRSPELLPDYVGSFQIFDHQIVTDLVGLDAAYRVSRVMLESDASRADGLDLPTVQSKLGQIREAIAKGKTIQSHITQVEHAADVIRSQAVDLSSVVLNLVSDIEAMLRANCPESNAA
jgi:hypothetical protein